MKVSKREDRQTLIEHMLAEVEAHFDELGARHPFIESLREQFDIQGDLSDKQIEALRKFYKNI